MSDSMSAVGGVDPVFPLVFLKADCSNLFFEKLEGCSSNF